MPIGGRIEITNDINYSDSCCILNVTELSITTILTVGDTIKGLSSSEIKKIAEESSVTILKNEIGSKLPEIASEFRKKIIKSIAEDAGDVIVADALNIVSDNALNIFESFDIDFTKLVVDSAASLGVGIAEDVFVAATAFIGATLKGMFIVADYLELSCFIMQIAIPRSDKAMKIHFDDENGCLVSNGVSIKAQDGTTDLSASNFVMHSIVLSNEEDLTSEIKQSLGDISNDYVVRDIYLERDGVVSQPGQTVQVYMPIPDNYDPNKCKLYWVKDDGTLEQKDFTVVGDNIVFTTDHFSYWALVNESSISAISVYSNPTKTTYYIGDSLNTSGLKLLATYSDDSTETITSGFTTSGFSSASAGTKTVTVSYEGFTDTFTVTVKTPSITLSSSSKNMSVGDSSTITATTTPSGQTVTWTSSNTSVATVSGGTITTKTSGSASITAKFTYNGITYSNTCSIVVDEVAVLESISVISNPTKTTYYVGDSLNTSGLKLLATYSDGSTKTITSGFATSGFDSYQEGQQTISVSYGGRTTSFKVRVDADGIFTISFDANGGINAPISQTFEEEVYFTITEEIPTRENYRFVGWGSFATSTMVLCEPGDYVCFSGEDRTLYAIWELNVVSGQCGDNAYYDLTLDTGELVISGTGSTWDYTRDKYTERPWNDYKDQIKKVSVESGITTIGDFSFAVCYEITDVVLSNTVESVGAYAFNGISKLSNVQLGGALTLGEGAFGSCDNLTFKQCCYNRETYILYVS